jgi:parallel beta-helix repeat protein
MMKRLHFVIVAVGLLIASGADAADVNINAGDTWATVVAANPAGSRFIVKAGVHRNKAIDVEARSGDSFIGEPGAIVTGARVLSSWTLASGGNGGTCAVTCYFASSQTQAGTVVDQCTWRYTNCKYPEDLWVDNVRYYHETARASVGAGEWFFDYTNDKIYVGIDPSGHTVETSVDAHALTNTGTRTTGVTIDGIIFEKFATPGGEGVIYAPNGDLWTLKNIEVRQSHAGGVSISQRMTVIGSRFFDNGQVGIGGYNGDGVLIADNNIRGNGWAFYPLWGGGGLKIAQMSRTVIRGNRAEKNFGYGLWCDIDCNDVTFEDNIADDNDLSGICFEISFNGIIRHNTIRRNGFITVRDGVNTPTALDPAFGNTFAGGIQIINAAYVDIYGNTIEANNSGVRLHMQSGRGASPLYGQSLYTWLLANVTVHDNVIAFAAGYNGLEQAVSDTTFFTSRNNVFRRNKYKLSGTAAFVWQDASRTDTEWRSTYGLDADGTLLRW